MLIHSHTALTAVSGLSRPYRIYACIVLTSGFVNACTKNKPSHILYCYHDQGINICPWTDHNIYGMLIYSHAALTAVSGLSRLHRLPVCIEFMSGLHMQRAPTSYNVTMTKRSIDCPLTLGLQLTMQRRSEILSSR